MAQLSIFDKQRHRSDKDMTVSIGKGDTVYITFRHDSWKRFTQGDKIAVSVTNFTLTFGDPDRDRGVAFKLASNKAGNPETIEHTRYIQIGGKAWPALLEAAQKMAGSYNFDEAPKFKADLIKAGTINNEELKEAMAKGGLMKLEPLEEEIPELIAPKGFIELHGAAAGERILVILSDIEQVCEVLPGSRITPSFLRPEEEKAKTVILGKRTACFLETYEEVIEKMREAMTPQVKVDKNGMTFWK